MCDFHYSILLYPLQTVLVGGSVMVVVVVGVWGWGQRCGGYTVFTLSVHYILVSEWEVSNKHCLLTFLVIFSTQ